MTNNVVKFLTHEDRERRDRCREVVEFARQLGLPELIDWTLVEAYEDPPPKVFRFSSKA